MLALCILLDEHAVALDPKTVAKVLESTNKLVAENHLTTLMITHNMRDTIAYGNRLIMMARVELWLTFETMRRSLRSNSF